MFSILCFIEGVISGYLSDLLMSLIRYSSHKKIRLDQISFFFYKCDTALAFKLLTKN
jgi:V8-like Glu-specific endopeptidase